MSPTGLDPRAELCCAIPSQSVCLACSLSPRPADRPRAQAIAGGELLCGLASLHFEQWLPATLNCPNLQCVLLPMPSVLLTLESHGPGIRLLKPTLKSMKGSLAQGCSLQAAVKMGLSVTPGSQRDIYLSIPPIPAEVRFSRRGLCMPQGCSLVSFGRSWSRAGTWPRVRRTWRPLSRSQSIKDQAYPERD